MSRYMPSVKRYGWIVVVVMLVAALGGVVIAHAMGSQYVVSSTVVVQVPASGSSGGLLVNNPTTSIAAANVYAAEVPSRDALTFVAHAYPELAKHGYSVDTLMKDVTATPSTTAGTISIQATGRTSADAVMITNDVANGFTAFVDQQAQQQNQSARAGLENELKQYQGQRTQLEATILNTQFIDKTTTSGYNSGNSAAYGTNNPAIIGAPGTSNSQGTTHGSNSSTTTTVPDPRYAVDMADLTNLNQTIGSLQTQLAALDGTTAGQVSVIQLATPADVAPSMKPLLVVAALLLIGLILGLLIAGLLIYLDRRLAGGDMVKERLGQSFLGEVSTDPSLESTPARPALRSAQQSANIYAGLCLMGFAQTVHPGRRGSILFVTSAREGEGKTTLACAIAGAVARAGTSVILVDGNLRRPTDHLSLGVTPSGPGLSGILAGEGTVDEAIQETDVPNLSFLHAGSPVEVPTLLLQDHLPETLRQVSEMADVVIVDGPCMLSAADGVLLATMADQVTLVVDARRDQLAQIERAVELLTSLAHAQVGVVLNRAYDARNDSYFASALQPSMLPERRVPALATANSLVPLEIGPATSNGNGLSGNGHNGNGLAELGTANHTLPGAIPESPVH